MLESGLDLEEVRMTKETLSKMKVLQRDLLDKSKADKENGVCCDKDHEGKPFDNCCDCTDKVRAKNLEDITAVLNDGPELIDDMDIDTQKVSIGTKVDVEYLDIKKRNPIAILGYWDRRMLDHIEVCQPGSSLCEAIYGKTVGAEIFFQNEDGADNRVKIHSISSYFQ